MSREYNLMKTRTQILLVVAMLLVIPPVVFAVAFFSGINIEPGSEVDPTEAKASSLISALVVTAILTALLWSTTGALLLSALIKRRKQRGEIVPEEDRL